MRVAASSLSATFSNARPSLRIITLGSPWLCSCSFASMAEGAAAEQQPVVSPTTVWVEWLATAEKGMIHNFFLPTHPHLGVVRRTS